MVYGSYVECTGLGKVWQQTTIWHLSTFTLNKRSSEPVVTALLYYCLQLGSRKIRALKKLGHQKNFKLQRVLRRVLVQFCAEKPQFDPGFLQFSSILPIGACLWLPKSASVKLKLQLSGHPSYGRNEVEIFMTILKGEVFIFLGSFWCFLEKV